MNDDRIVEVISFVFGYTKSVTDWITIKKEILKFISSDERRYFSTRDPLTKKQTVNDFERRLMAKWFETTGVELIFNEK